MKKLKLFLQGCFVALLCLFCGVPVFGAEKALEELASGALRNQQQIQKMAETWSAEEKKLLVKIERLTARRDRLQVQSEQLGQALKVEDQRVAQQRHRLAETKKLRDGLQVWLQEIVRQHSDEAEQSLPFLVVEREKRQADLETVLVDPYTPLYEKFRRVFEVFLVETEFGYSSEVYRDDIQLGENKLQVDLLRIGRTALFFRTPDGSKSGFYDPLTQQFRSFSESIDLSRAIALVRREAAAEMVSLPVGRIVLP